MRGVRGWLIAFLMMLLPLGAQQWDELPVPAEPVRGILDEARLFVTDPERLVLLENDVLAVSERHGVPVRVVIFDTLIGQTLDEQAAQLSSAWFGDEPGVLLVTENDSGRWKIVWADGGPVSTEGAPAVPVLPPGVVAPQERLLIEQRLRGVERTRAGSTGNAEVLVRALVGEIDRALTKGKNEGTGRTQVVVLGTGLLAGLSLLGLLGWQLMRRIDRRQAERLVFPDVEVAMRLGAPCGGGKIKERAFGDASRG